jgi:nitrogen PTS system EIIA component
MNEAGPPARQRAMKIVDFIREDLVIPELHGKTKPEVLGELAAKLATTSTTVSQADLMRVLSERERLASTAIGDGVAIPHGKLDAVGHLVACIARAPDGVDFDAIDGRPTHIFFALVAPENSTGAHLKALARISRLFKGDPEFRSKLLAAATAPAIYKLIADEDSKY